MDERRKNPFLPKKTGIHWRVGTAKGTIGLPPIPEALDQTEHGPAPYKRSPRGRKPKDRSIKPKVPEPIHADGPQPARKRLFPNAGRLQAYFGAFDIIANAGWGTAADLVTLAHGPVGCGIFIQAGRDVLSDRIQGVEGFSEHHFTTALDWDDLRVNGGDLKLARALDEIDELFPLANGSLILSEDPVGLIESDIHAVARAKNATHDKLVIGLSSENYHLEYAPLARQELAAFRLAAERTPMEASTPHDVALTFMRRQTGLCWIVARLLTAIGLNVIHQLTGTSAAEIGRVTRCRLSIGFAPMLDVPHEHLATGYARMLEKTFSIPIQWTCFVSPSATTASLRAVAANFDKVVQARAENVIAEGAALISAIVRKYRPRLEGKLMMHFFEMTQEELEPFRLLGLRIGNPDGWPGRQGRWRTPRLVCNRDYATEKSIDALLVEAKPDLVLYGARDEYEWIKRGRPALRESPLCNRFGENIYWSYDGFACLAAELDRLVNAPWRKLVNPPWTTEGGG